MLDIIKKLLNDPESKGKQKEILREFLQILILKIMSDGGYFNNLVFTGGTSLRILYDLQRFSEDLDFSLIQKSRFSFREMVDATQKKLYLYGLETEIPNQKNKTVLSTFIKFPNLLYDLKLSPISNQKLSIKLEIDTNPPTGWNTKVSLINKQLLFTIVHFDLASLFATKLHACFYRKYTKGRDFYDFIWYIGKKTIPNFEVLNNAILQTEGINLDLKEDNFLRFLQNKLKKVDWIKAKRDVEPFLINKTELQLFDANLMMEILESKYGK